MVSVSLATVNGEVEGSHGAVPNLPATVEPLQVKEEEGEEENENFSSVVQTKLSKECENQASVIGLEVRILIAA